MSLKRAHWQLKFETFNKQISKLHYACSNIDLILVSKEEKSKTDLTKKKNVNIPHSLTNFTYINNVLSFAFLA